jgi:hypothetical protein
MSCIWLLMLACYYRIKCCDRDRLQQHFHKYKYTLPTHKLRSVGQHQKQSPQKTLSRVRQSEALTPLKQFVSDAARESWDCSGRRI